MSSSGYRHSLSRRSELGWICLGRCLAPGGCDGQPDVLGGVAGLDGPGSGGVASRGEPFSGERALDFVLSSKDDLMDKTLMFDIKLVRVR